MGFFTTFLFLGMLVSTTGKVLLGIAVLAVHHKVVKEHGIDGAVLTELKHEYKISILAICLIILGFLMEVLHFGGIV